MAIVAFFRLKSESGGILEHVALLVGILAVAQILTMIFMQPKFYEA